VSGSRIAPVVTWRSGLDWAGFCASFASPSSATAFSSVSALVARSHFVNVYLWAYLCFCVCYCNASWGMCGSRRAGEHPRVSHQRYPTGTLGCGRVHERYVNAPDAYKSTGSHHQTQVGYISPPRTSSISFLFALHHLGALAARPRPDLRHTANRDFS
jgi:hypothetical protein